MECICPKCKSNNVIPIMYGYPAPEAMEEVEKVISNLVVVKYLLVVDSQIVSVKTVSMNGA